MNHAKTLSRLSLLLAALALWALPGDAPALVKPLTIIDAQIRRPNVLIVFDNSNSMVRVPGERETDWSEVGEDCFDGEYCATVGHQGRCFFSRAGKHGAGISEDLSRCTAASDCNKGWCENITYRPKQCLGDADCAVGEGTCTGNCTACSVSGTFCTDNLNNLGNCPSGKTCCPGAEVCLTNTTTCTANAGCSGGRLCAGVCSLTITKPTATQCTTDADCLGPPFKGECGRSTYTDRCETNASATKEIQMCVVGHNICETSDQCTTVPGDTCGNASSRMRIAKHVIGEVVAKFHPVVNFGFMAFHHSGYYHYLEMSAGFTNKTVERYLEKDQLIILGCWTKNNGPTPTCKVDVMNTPLDSTDDITFNRRLADDSRYRVKTGPQAFIIKDAPWGGTFKEFTEGTGVFIGAHYSQTDQQESGTVVGMHEESAYAGRTHTHGAKSYVYYTPPTNQRTYNSVAGLRDPVFWYQHEYDVDNDSNGTTEFKIFDPGNSSSQTYTCNDPTYGGKWDSALIPFLSTSEDVNVHKAFSLRMTALMEPTRQGGLAAASKTPTGCTLWNDTAAATTSNNAFSYLKAVKQSDPLSCRDNYVILVTDGRPSSGNDVECGVPGCDVTTLPDGDSDGRADLAFPPTAPPWNTDLTWNRNTYCACQSVHAAYKLYKPNDANAASTKTFVVAFSKALRDDTSEGIMGNVAKAGGTSDVGVLYATRMDELREQINKAVYETIKSSYSTSPSTVSGATQTASNAVTQGTLLLDTRVDFPGWNGNLIAYEPSVSPDPVWDAAAVSFPPDDPDTTGVNERDIWWRNRNVWTFDPSDKTPIKIEVDGSGNVPAALKTKLADPEMGLGFTEAEAERVVWWLLGKPESGNPAVLSAIVNSTPIDVGPPGKSPMPGGQQFWQDNQTRPYLTYVGSSSGTLHAFFTKDVNVGGTQYYAGQEAFAIIPPDMLYTQRLIYAQNGQLPDPKEHIYGIANSPKVKNVCVSGTDSVCTGLDPLKTPKWKTLMVVTYGFGGEEVVTLDITNPFTTTGVKTTTSPVGVLWTTYSGGNSVNIAYNKALGMTTSVPAFYYGKTADMDSYRIGFGSYVQLEDGSANKKVISSLLKNGTILDNDDVTPPSPPDGANDCPQALGILSDVASARDFNANEYDKIIALYFGDTWGNLYRWVPTQVGGDTGNTGSASAVIPPSDVNPCDHPIHFAPALAQLNRDNPSNPQGIFIVQVTNSALDPETKSYPASKMVIRKDLPSAGSVVPDPDFTNITWVTGTADMCALTPEEDGTCPDGPDAGTAPDFIPTTARPASTPMTVLRSDGDGFIIITTWYNYSPTGCDLGTTYLTIHQYTISQGGKQIFATTATDQPMSSAAFVGGKLVYVGSGGGDLTDLSTQLTGIGVGFDERGAGGGGAAGDRFTPIGWTELP